ncbi:MAG: bifunctional phosphopantothenoylcysteine decarboxylase/phosphopantothenate--cysteine ligase CoaBC [Firmicutes bacterium]|nr:bifunctional phosphopantothenoylcysteine decarboxylase/phosphopantothenate--cysteine ligase CoaBC [Bacillota bacterium]
MSGSFLGKTVTLGVTGGIAAYKACEITSLLKKGGADVHVVLTRNACEFVQPLTFESLSGNRVTVESFDRNFVFNVAHISLSKKSDAFLIAPATANFIGKYACGIADDFLSTTVMAFNGPVLLAPAMNTQMLQSAAVCENMQKLSARGVHFVPPAIGMLACGDEGKGRLAEIPDIVSALHALLFPLTDYAGKTVLITSGATRESIDPVRYITNPSTGAQGAAIAEAAAARGARIIYIHGKNARIPHCACYKTVEVTSTQDMLQAVLQHLPKADVIIKAAAPSDYTTQAAAQKIKSAALTLTLTKNTDIAAQVGKAKGNKKLVIFAAETENLEKNAQEKLKKKNADIVVANDVTAPGAGFGTDTNIVSILSASGVAHYKKMSKREVADVLLDSVIKLF